MQFQIEQDITISTGGRSQYWRYQISIFQKMSWKIPSPLSTHSILTLKVPLWITLAPSWMTGRQAVILPMSFNVFCTWKTVILARKIFDFALNWTGNSIRKLFRQEVSWSVLVTWWEIYVLAGISIRRAETGWDMGSSVSKPNKIDKPFC